MDFDLIIIGGPTASGKSALALELARLYNGEIINCDSMQLYKTLDIGTAKPTAAERAEIPHHLLDIYDISERSDVYKFRRMALDCIAEILSRKKLPVLVGGSGFYLKALTDGLDDLPGDIELRKKLDLEFDGDENFDKLRAVMAQKDPAALEKFNNHQRKLIRALEVFELTGKSILELQKNTPEPFPYKYKFITILPDRELLKQKIRLRAGIMLDQGWINEADNAIKNGLLNTPTAHQALGYAEIGKFINGDFTREQLIESISTKTWQFARRQYTWFRHQHPESIIISTPEDMDFIRKIPDDNQQEKNL